MGFVHIEDVLQDRDLAETMDPGLVALLARLHETAQETRKRAHEPFDAFVVTVSPDGSIDVNTDANGAFADWVWAAGDLALHVGPRSGYVKGEMRTVTEILGHDESGPVQDGADAATASFDDDTDDDDQDDEAVDEAAPVDASIAATGPSIAAAMGVTNSWSPWGSGLVVDPTDSAAGATDAPAVAHWAPWSAVREPRSVEEAVPFNVYQCIGCLAISDNAADFDAESIPLKCDSCGGDVITRHAVRTDTQLLLL